MDLFHLIDSLSLERPKSYRAGRHMQSGAFFKTICTVCNSARLGARYDPELVNLANGVTTLLRSSLDLPDSVAVTCQPGMVARAVLGHLLAVGVGRTERTELLDAVRDFVVNEELPWPEGIEIHYWLYPYTREVLIRDAALAVDLFATHVVFWCMKFFPVGFLVTWASEHPELIRLPKLSSYVIGSGRHPAPVKIDLLRMPHQFWPEAPSEEGAVMYGDAAYAAYRR